MSRLVLYALTGFLAIMLSACNLFGSAPTIESFVLKGTSIVDANTIQVELEWEVEGADSLSIDQGIGDVTGKTSVTTTAAPDAEISYTLTASNDKGDTTESLTVMTPDTESATIISFTATSEQLDPDTLRITLNWQVMGTAPIDLSIDQGVGQVTGTSTTIDIAPSERTTFTLNADNGRGSDSASVTVGADATSGKERIEAGLSADDALLFDDPVFFVDYYRLEPVNDGEIIEVSLIGSDPEFDTYLYIWDDTLGELIDAVDDFPGVLEVSYVFAESNHDYIIGVSTYIPEDTGDYILEVDGTPIIESFSASPFVVDVNSSSTLMWSIFGAVDSVSISPDIGDVTALSEIQTPPLSSNTSYTLSASNRFGEASASTSVQLRQTVEISLGTDDIAFIRPETFAEGNSVTVNLPALAEGESVAVIPVHASQAFDVDSLSYQLVVNNITPFEPVEPAPRASYRPRLTAAQQQFLSEMSKAKAAYLSERQTLIQESNASLSPQAFDDNCPPPYEVGTTMCDFYVLGESRDTTLLFESANALFFVDNAALGEFTEAQLADQARRYEDELLPLMARYFTTPQDFDNNGKIFIVMSSIPFFGYVDPTDFFSEDEIFGSNEGDIFYAALPSDFEDFFTIEEWFELWLPSTLVHELKHLVVIGKRFVDGSGFEDSWWEEGSAVGAEELSPYPSDLSGYAQGAAEYGLAFPQFVRLVNEQFDTFSWYGYNFLYLWWVAEQVGLDAFWQPWALGPESGVANLEKNMISVYPNFAESMLAWALVLMFDHTNLVAGFDFDKLNLRDGSWARLGYMPLQNDTGEARSMAYYVGTGQSSDASVNISSLNDEPYFIVVRFSGELPY